MAGLCSTVLSIPSGLEVTLKTVPGLLSGSQLTVAVLLAVAAAKMSVGVGGGPAMFTH